mgnify:CR=1 FL=1
MGFYKIHQPLFFFLKYSLAIALYNAFWVYVSCLYLAAASVRKLSRPCVFLFHLNFLTFIKRGLSLLFSLHPFNSTNQWCRNSSALLNVVFRRCSSLIWNLKTSHPSEKDSFIFLLLLFIVSDVRSFSFFIFVLLISSTATLLSKYNPSLLKHLSSL